MTALFSNRVDKLKKSIKNADEICRRSLLSLLEAAKIDEHSELIKLALAKARNDLDRFKTVVFIFKKTMDDE